MTNPTDHSPTQFWKQQSPVILTRQHSFYVPFPQGMLKFDYRDAPFSGILDGEKGHMNFVLDKPHTGKHLPQVKFGELTAELTKIHLHMPSEHDIDGLDQAGEIHLLHKISSPVTGSENLVVAVFFKENNKAVRSGFFEAWHATSSGGCELDPRTILPLKPGTSRYVGPWYRYEGSLTSAPYTENVSWVVLQTPLEVHSADLALLAHHASQPERKTHPLNRRYVLRNFK